jgi:hypothetical protein
MKNDDQNPAEKNSDSPADSSSLLGDWPSLLMIFAAVAISAWCFWPSNQQKLPPESTIAIGKPAPGLWTVDLQTGSPLLGLVPRGWFTWVVLAPASPSQSSELNRELKALEETWQTLADLDGWRRVVVVADENLGKRLKDEPLKPILIPFDVSRATLRTWAAWGSAEKVRHILIEPTGKIILIEPSESFNPGTLKKIADDLTRRLRSFEGEFDDMPRFSCFPKPFTKSIYPAVSQPAPS